MQNGQKFERYFQNFTSHIRESLPDGMLEITPEITQKLLYSADSIQEEPLLTRYFQFFELSDKMILVNHQFIVWIVPSPNFDQEKLTVFIAQNRAGEPHLELGFNTSLLSDPSRIVLRIIEKFLIEIQENEASIRNYEEK